MTNQSRFFNPLKPKAEPTTVNSQSSDKEFVSASGAFAIENPNHCPKCSSATVPTPLMSGEIVMFCTNCRVSMALKQQ